MIWIFAVAIILVLVGFAYLKGKCDGFIAGYNKSRRSMTSNGFGS